MGVIEETHVTAGQMTRALPPCFSFQSWNNKKIALLPELVAKAYRPENSDIFTSNSATLGPIVSWFLLFKRKVQIFNLSQRVKESLARGHFTKIISEQHPNL